MIAQILASIKIMKQYLLTPNPSLKKQIILMLIFGGVGILSTSLGFVVNGALANTRVIGVMAGGFIGGPFVGIGASVIAAIHRYAIDPSGFATIACVVSTLAEGMIAAYFSTRVKKYKYRGLDLFSITMGAEILQMLIILILAKPFNKALELVLEIAFPMVFINSIGMVLFVGVFKHIFIEQENELGKKISLAFDITKKCLPIIKTGQYNKSSCKKIAKIILDFSNQFAVIFTDRDKIIYSKGKLSIADSNILPQTAVRVFREKKVCITDKTGGENIVNKVFDSTVAIGAPLSKNGEIFGCLIIFTNDYKLSMETEIKFVEGLSELLSLQYELSERDKQKELLQKAEFQALQSQINPHFIFNSLNTISAFCREKPEKARELLIDLATYFRTSIENKEGMVSIYDEMDYVDAYLQLEKARFEDRLHIELQIEKDIDCKIPCLILQPLVENAVKHGAMKKKIGFVKIIVSKQKKHVKISVVDNGNGIPEEILEKLLQNDTEKNIGLVNVHRRLLYIYGSDNGLKIHSSHEGTKVDMYVPMK